MVKCSLCVVLVKHGHQGFIGALCAMLKGVCVALLMVLVYGHHTMVTSADWCRCMEITDHYRKDLVYNIMLVYGAYSYTMVLVYGGFVARGS